MVIPDVQAKPGVSFDHLEHIGRYAADKRPEVIVQIGDFADMESLCSYDRGKRSFEGRRYRKDVDASLEAMGRLCGPIQKARGYHPRMVLTLGNHEDRITRAVDDDARLEGTIGLNDLRYEEFGWDVIPFLEPIRIAGTEFVHYFVSGAMGRPVASAAVILRERMGSGVQGHTQFTDIAFHRKTQHIGLMCGIAYSHEEKYLGAQGNTTRRQVWMLHEAKNGMFDPMAVSLGFLKRRYGRVSGAKAPSGGPRREPGKSGRSVRPAKRRPEPATKRSVKTGTRRSAAATTVRGVKKR